MGQTRAIRDGRKKSGDGCDRLLQPLSCLMRLRRSIALTAAALFLISLAFPAVAEFVKNPQAWPKWWGVLDVALAFVLVVLVLVELATARDRVNKEVEQITYKVYRVLIWAIFLLM